jgi:hypothetical protein
LIAAQGNYVIAHTGEMQADHDVVLADYIGSYAWSQENNSVRSSVRLTSA